MSTRQPSANFRQILKKFIAKIMKKTPFEQFSWSITNLLTKQCFAGKKILETIAVLKKIFLDKTRFFQHSKKVKVGKIHQV